MQYCMYCTHSKRIKSSLEEPVALYLSRGFAFINPPSLFVHAKLKQKGVRTSDQLISITFYSQPLYQLSYSNGRVG